MVGDVAQYRKEVLQQVADEYGFWAGSMEVMEDHVHAFVERGATSMLSGGGGANTEGYIETAGVQEFPKVTKTILVWGVMG